MTARGNPRAKMREEEDELDRSLSEAGLLEEGMAIEEKKQLMIMLNESKQSAEKEKEMRRHSEIGTSRQAEQEEEQDDEVEMVCDETSSTKKQRIDSPDLFENSQDQEAVKTSPFGPTEHVNNSAISDTGEEVEQDKGNDEIFKSDSEDEIFKSDEETENVAPQPIQHENAESFQSAVEAMEDEDDDSVTLLSSTHIPTSPEAEGLFKSALRCDILKCIVDDEPVPFYKTFLAERPRNNLKQIPLYYDKSLNLTPEQHYKAVDAALKKDSAIHARMLLQKKCFEYTEKWATPIKEGYEKDIASLDKIKPYQEPAECITLPWGAKPLVLNYQYNPKKSIRDSLYKFASKPGLSLTRLLQSATASTSGSSSGNAQKSEALSTIPMVQLETLTPEQLKNASAARNEPEKTNRPRRENAGVKKTQPDIYTYQGDEEDDDWLESNKQGFSQRGKGRARGRGRGVRGATQVNRGGKKGKGRQHNDGRQQTLLVGVHAPTVRARTGASAALSDDQISQELNHPALVNNVEETMCPICHQNFPKNIIENHAATCGMQETPPEW